MTERPVCRLYPENREAEDEQDQEDHDEHIKQEAGDIRRCRRYAGEAEDACNDRDQKEKHRPSEKCHRPLLPAFAAAGPVAAIEIADLTSSAGAWRAQFSK